MNERLRSGDEKGFTLVEVIAAITIEALIIGALGMAFIALIRGSGNMAQNFNRSGDARAAAQYIVSDARNSSGPEISLSDTTSCPDASPPVAGTASPVVRFNFNTTTSSGTTTANIVNYVLVSNSLLRRQCVGGTLVRDKAVASNVASVTTTCAPTANCTGTPTSITVAVTSVADSNGAVYQYSLSGSFRKLVGDGAPPADPAFVVLTGIEQGVASPTYKGIFSTVSGGVTADSSIKRNGSYSLSTIPTGSVAAYADYNFPSTGSVTVARFAVRLASLPSGDRNLVSLQTSSGQSGVLAYQSSTQKLAVRWGGVASYTAGGSTVSTGTWYVVDMRVNFGTNPRTLDWRINGTTQTAISSSETASTGNAIRLGTSNLTAYTANFDDIAVSQTTGDYPMGDGKVLMLEPDGMGTHNNSSHFQSDSGSSIGSTTYNRLDEEPVNSTADYIKQVSSSSSSYIEMTFDDAVQTCVDGVAARVAFGSSATGGNNGQARIYNGATATTALSGDMSTSGTTIDYADAALTATTGEWTATEVNALEARIGYSSDVSPVPYWHQLMLEYEIPAVSSECDTTAPDASATVIRRSDGSGTVGHIDQGSSYYVYANVTDAVSPAIGMGTVTADVSDFDSGVTAASLTTSGGPWTVSGVSYNYRSSTLTADSSLNTGTSYAYSLAMADAAGNSSTANGSVTIDTYADMILATTGLLGYWPLDDTATSMGTDTFLGSTGAAITSRTGELGATWTAVSGNSTTATITASDTLRRSGTGTAGYYASAVPTSANYTVEADLNVQSILSSDAAGVIGRASTSAETFYSARYSATNDRWELVKDVNGSFTTLDTYAQVLTAGTSYRLKLDMSGTTIRLLVDGTERCNATDSSISSTGRGGVRLGASSSSQSDTTGLQLDNWTVTSSPPVAQDDKGSNDGTYNSGVMLNNDGALTGSTNTSAKFDGIEDYVRIARQISDDFTIEFWFKSSQGLNTNPQWWGNAGMVDAEVNAQTTDFGVSLQSDGNITAGVGGASDTTIVSSSAGFNDGNWHHVAFRRTKSSGALALYVDGNSQGTATGTTSSLTAPSYIRFGALQTGNIFFDGKIDEVAIYNTALSGTTISDHYDAGTG